MTRLIWTEVPADSPAVELVEVLKAVESPCVSPERRTRILTAVLRRSHSRPSAVWRFLSPAALSISLLSVGLATSAATMAPRLGWRWRGGTRAQCGDCRADLPSRAASLAPQGPIQSQPPRSLQPPFAGRAHAVAGETAAPMVAAIRALRRQHQPARAERLALDYLRRYPHGALTEEALAVAIEGSAQDGDGQAQKLAERYLRQYPSGRFRSLAEQAQTQSP